MRSSSKVGNGQSAAGSYQNHKVAIIGRDRRGVLLLVVLSLLILFVMIAVTYVLVATRHLAASRNYGRAATTGHDANPKLLLDGAMMQLVRGTVAESDQRFRSVIGPHSLLEDFYGGPNGEPIFCGRINGTPNSMVSGQIIELDVSADTKSPFALTNNANTTVSQVEGYYEGCLLTIVKSGSPANGLSTRIVRHTYDASASKTYLRVLPLKGNAGPVTLSDQETFIINGRPFAGTGFGFNPGTANKTVDAKSANTLVPLTTPMQLEYALLPNPAVYKPTGDYASNVPFGGWGGANEDYDAPDYQNMHMAWLDNVNPPNVILPSFHRPDLINYWLKHVKATDPTFTWTATGGKELLRSVMLRPLGPMSVDGVAISGANQVDHPNFTGSNSFDAVKGPWDVDNDGDGIPDSVWLDLGYPVQSTSDGRLFKPLFAILCIDLDGRMNVNAHGTTEQIDTGNTYKHTDQIPADASNPKPFAGKDGLTAVTLPRGEGYGPAEIDLVAGSLSTTDVTELLRGKGSGQKFQGRYAGTAGGTDQAGKTGTDEPLGMVKHFQFPDRTLSAICAFKGSPPDLWGRASVGIDYNGQPFFWGPRFSTDTTGSWMQSETHNSPYDLNLSREVGNPGSPSNTQANDSPFTVFELERLLRQSDIDSAELPQRLWQLSGTAALNAQNAALRSRLLTTDSWDIPGPNSLYPLAARRQVLAGLPSPEQFSSNHISSWLAYKLRSPAPEAALGLKKANENIRDLLAPELISGLRMNINRPLGDGRDNDNNGIVDEPTVAELSAEGQSQGVNAPSWAAGYPSNGKPKLNLTNGLSVSGPDPSDQKTHVKQTDGLNARQLLARHLYVLARLMIDDSFLGNPTTGSAKNGANHWFDNDPNVIDGPTQYKASARRIAQWAVNVVDFMDADSIMTPFEYDLYPFSTKDLSTGTPKTQINPQLTRTWCVDGIIDDGVVTSADDTASYRGLVWGCERPELLITETFAFHDRRTEDTEDEKHDSSEADGSDTKGKTTDTPANKTDGSFDQRLMPRSGFFVELYNPWGDNARSAPAELANVSDGGVRLDKQSIDASPSPVWRLAVINSDKDPDDPNTPQAQKDIERSVYFRNIANGSPTLPDDDGARYYSSLPANQQLPIIKPGRYGVIGSSGDAPVFNGAYEICLGRSTEVGVTEGSRDTLKVGSTQRIVLTPSNDFNKVNQVDVLTNTNPGASGNATPLTDTQPCIAVVINQPTSLSISAPTPKLTMTPPRPKGYPTDPTDPYLVAQGVTWSSGGAGGEGVYQPPLDVPLDQSTIQPDAELHTNTFRDDFRRVHLQRLANPLKKWNRYSNPYLTIDSMSVPLNKFNGIKDVNSNDVAEPVAGRNPDKLVTYERGQDAPPTERNVWHYDFTVPTLPGTTPGTTPGLASHAMGRNLQHTLGYLNNKFAGRWNSGNAPPSPNDQPPVPGVPKFYVGAPDNTKDPFPWLVWNNRPYSSVSELMLVPASSSSRLAREVTTLNSGNPYKDDTSGVNRVAFGHLLNYFNSDENTASAPNMARILEYLSVPSPFVGTETVLSPKAFEWDCNQPNQMAGEPTSKWPNQSGGTEPAGTAGLHPPFNTVSKHRDPGRVNINTIALPQVWNAILGGTGAVAPGPQFGNIQSSRQGYPGSAYQFDDTYPSIFGNPFRSAAGADMVPIPGIRTAPGQKGLAHKPTNVTLWRAEGIANATPPQKDIDTTSDTPLLAKNPTTEKYNDQQRNAYFHFQPINRLTNKLTTHSNVYAVWVTVGYFEVSPAPAAPSTPPGAIDPWPDRYQLGQELGSDTGEIERHRGFYIIDRSIPVGFGRGQDLNSGETVLLKRFIE